MWDIVSPDRKIKVVRHSLGNSGASRDFCGDIKIPNTDFQLGDRLFYDPMVFSDNSRFLAAAESVSLDNSYDNSSRVVIFDFKEQKEIIAYTEIRGGIVSLCWTDGSLHIGAHSNLHSTKEHTWRPKN